MSGNDSETEPTRARMDGEDGSLTLGGGGVGGDVEVRDEAGASRFEVDGDSGSMALADEEGRAAVEYRGDVGAFVIGGEERPGRILLRDGEAGVAGEIRAQEGQLTIFSADGVPALTINPNGTIETARPIKEGEGGRGR